MARAKECVNRTELIISAAQVLFGRYGFERTTIDDIAREAGIGKGSVYLEFKNKDDIQMELISRFVKRKQLMVQAHLDQASSPYLDGMKQMLHDSIMASYDVATAHMHTTETLIHSSRRIKAGFKDHFVFINNAISCFIEKAAANGELCLTESAQRYAELIMLSCTGLMPPYIQFRIPDEIEVPSRINNERNSLDLITLLIDGLKKRK